MARQSLDEIFAQPTQGRPSLDQIFGDQEIAQKTSFLQSAVQPIKNIIPEAEKAAESGLSSMFAPLPRPTGSIRSDILTGLADPFKRVMGAAEYVSSPITGAVRALASQPATQLGVSAGLSPQAAQNWIGNPIDIVGQIAVPMAAVKYGPEIWQAGKTAIKSLPTIGESGISTRQAKNAANAVDLSGVPASSQDLRAAAKPFYDRFTQSGGVYSPKLTNEIADIAAASKSKGVAGQMKPADAALNDSLSFYENLRSKPLSVEDLQALDQSLAEDISRFNRAGEYNFGRKLNDLKYALREKAFNADNAKNYIQAGSPEAVNDLVTGNQLWSQSYKAADIEKIIQKAQGTNTPQSSIRTGIKNLLANDKKMAMYSDAEKAALQEAMKRGNLGGLLYNAGGRLTDSLAGMVAGSAGGPVGSIAGAMAGKAIGGGLGDIAGNVQAKRLGGAVSIMQKSLPQEAKLAAAMNNKELISKALKRSGKTIQEFKALSPDKQAFYLGVKK